MPVSYEIESAHFASSLIVPAISSPLPLLSMALAEAFYVSDVL